MKNNPSIGLIGAGLMGIGIGESLLRNHFPLLVLAHKNRVNIEELKRKGASEADSISELIKNSNVIITCLPSIISVEEVYEGKNGIVQNAAEGTVVIDTTTSDPKLTRSLHAKAEHNGLHLIEAPLLGPPAKTKDGTISVAVGGTETGIEKALPILEAFTGNIFKAGGPGSGHTIKLINNAVTLTNSAILYETFSVARKMGVDLNTLYEVLDTSMASSKRLHVIGPALIHDDHEMRFAIDVATKDLVLYTEVAGKSGVPIVVGEAAKIQYRLSQSLGYGSENVTKIASALAELAGASFSND